MGRRKKIILRLIVLILSFGLWGILPLTSAQEKDKASQVPDYPIKPVNFWEVKVTDEFWAPRMETNRLVTIPYLFPARS